MNVKDAKALLYLSDRSKYILESNILPFWKEAMFDKDSQRFNSFVDEQWLPDRGYPLTAILLCRMLWAYSVIFEESKDSEAYALAQQAYLLLTTAFKDSMFGGVFYQISTDFIPLILQKRTFAQAFYVIALARFAKVTGNEEALKEANVVYSLLLKHAQIVPGGFTDTLARDWRNDNDEHIWWMNSQGATFIYNSQLHMLEAAIELQQANPNNEGIVQLDSQITFILNNFLDPITHHLYSSIDNNMAPLDRTVSFSNNLETAYLLRRAARLVGMEKQINEICVQWVRGTLDLAEDTRYGGLFFSYHEEQGLNRCKVWYVHAEAMVALLDAYEVTNDLYFLNKAVEIWKFVEENLVDWEHGEWFASAVNKYMDPQSLRFQELRDARTGPEKASAYKCPYHTVRACLEVQWRAKKINQFDT